MTGPTPPDSGDCCEDLPVFLEGGDRLAVELRELAFGLLLATGAGVEPRRLATLANADEAHVSATLDALAGAGRIDRDADGRVLGSAGLTIADGPHGLEIQGRTFRTWCAFDAIGIPAALGSDARISTACGVCGQPIRIELDGGRPTADSPARLWLSDGGADMRADFCTPTVLLCSGEHALDWSERRAGHGRALSLAEAIDEGARSWASPASTAARFGSSR